MADRDLNDSNIVLLRFKTQRFRTKKISINKTIALGEQNSDIISYLIG